jgi:hypothetical protein
VKAFNTFYKKGNLKMKAIEVNAVVRTYFEVKRAYLAGFFDADGAIMAIIESHKAPTYVARLADTLAAVGLYKKK